MKIVRKWVLSLIFMAICIVSVAVGFVMYQEKLILKDIANDNLIEQNEGKILRLNMFFDDCTEDINGLIMRGSIANEVVAYINGNDSRIDNQDYLRTLLFSHLNGVNHFSNLYLVYPDGRINLSANGNSEGELLFEGGTKSVVKSSSRIIERTTENGRGWLVYAPIEGFSGVTPLIVGEVFSDELLYTTSLENKGNLITGFYTLGAEGERLGGSSDTDEITLPSKYFLDCKAGNGGFAVFEKGSVGMVHARYDWVPKLGMCLVSEVSEFEAFSTLSSLKKNLFFIGSGALLSIVLVALLLTIGITKPLVSLTNMVKGVGEGDFKTKNLISSDDEIGDLAKAFNKMVDELKDYQWKEQHRGEIIKSGIEKKTSQLNAEMNEIQSVRMATLNMMEDLDVAYTKLKNETKLKDELFNITSHELKSPLVPIVGYLNLLKSGKIRGTLSNEQKNVLDVIERNALRLSSLIEDVLDIARLQSGKMKFNFKEDSFSQVIQEVDERFRTAVESKGLQYIVEYPKKLPKMIMDRSRLVQVVSNLVGNALKFTEKGAISVHVTRSGNEIICEVSDTGMGIEKKDLEKVFEKFYQTEPSLTRQHGGSGLGLAISKGIVTEHHGTIKVDSELGKGSVFRFVIPLKAKIQKKVEQ